MRHRIFLIALVSISVALSGCAGRNTLIGSSTAGGGPAGFWWGLLHGAITPVAFVISLFNHEISIYEGHNNGAWYNGGFILGAGAWGILRGSQRRSKSRPSA